MRKWGKSCSGNWSLELAGHRVSLPHGFQTEHESENLVGFAGETADGAGCHVIHSHDAIESILRQDFCSPRHKIMGRDNCKGLELIEVAPTKKNGHAQPLIRTVLLRLSDTDTLIVFGVSRDSVFSLIRRSVELL